MAKREVTTNLSSLLGAGVDCEGTARVEGTLRLDGTFRGNLEVGETLIIGPTGSFTGTACAREVVISGRFVGEVLGTEQVELQQGARLEGDVLTRQYIIEPGVYFQGNCRMEFSEADEARLRVARGEEKGEPEEPASEDEAVVRSLSN
jgi:cytoskeletal protein CcmA (bactofilin family)